MSKAAEKHSPAAVPPLESETSARAKIKTFDELVEIAGKARAEGK